MAETNLPKTTVQTVTIAEVSDILTKNGKEFRMVTFIDEHGKSQSLPVNEKFYLRNNARFQPDVVVQLTTQEVIEGKTHWVDDAGKKNVHTYSGTNVSSVVRATAHQAKMQTLNALETRLLKHEENPATMNALATMYGNMLR